jgi:tRNA(Ile2)-agmatinylcytidine synthase
MYLTNQGTDGHLKKGSIGALVEGHSYRLAGRVTAGGVTGRGGHVSIELGDAGHRLRCMAYEPTKGFRDIARALILGDLVEVCGSYKGGSLNLEKLCLVGPARDVTIIPPRCPSCGKRMTSAGRLKGYKCRTCGGKSAAGEERVRERTIGAGWYEVPPCARRHLARPLARGEPEQVKGRSEIVP